jgi:hypothetical protein
MIQFSYMNRRYQDRRRRVEMGAACILIRDATRQARHHAFPVGTALQQSFQISIVGLTQVLLLRL